MAEALTEVVLEVRIPEHGLGTLLQQGKPGRIVLHPLAANGSGPPTRYLVCVQGIDADRHLIESELRKSLNDLQSVREDNGCITYVANLDEGLRTMIHERFHSALEGVGGEIIARPVLIQNGRMTVSFLTTRAGPVEEGVRRLVERFAGSGLNAHLIRIGVQHPAEQAFGLYDDGLTDKQTEILRLALALGLYDTPRRCTLENLAHIFGISKAAAHSRMKTAERKILHRYFTP